MSSNSAGPLNTVRTALWHFRQGGLKQVREWQRRSTLPGSKRSLAARERRIKGRLLVSFDPADLPAYPPVFPQFKVATILDDFSALAWGYEFTTVPVTPHNWPEKLETEEIDFFFAESAWHGNDDAWRHQFSGKNGPGAHLQELLAYCKDTGIPTVFWNKEDPPHFEDFLEAAKLFDHVFTTDVTLIPEYKAALGHDRVHVLPFAASSAIHNPVRPKDGFHERDVAFAGMYFAHKFPERREQMDYLLGGALDASAKMERGLEIFSRFLGDDERYQFPGELNSRVVGSLTYRQMLSAYKSYKAFLNVNSVVSSESMCARRIFEIVASGTPVVSSPSPAISAYFPASEVPVVSDREQARDTVRAIVRSPELSDRMAHKAQRRIWRHHTYSDRAVRVLRTVAPEKPYAPVTLPSVSAVVCTNRPQQLDHVLTQAAQQKKVDLQLVLVPHGFQPDELSLRAKAKDLGIDLLVITPAGRELRLGEVFNQGVQAADGALVSKFDDDDFYGPHYFEDLCHALMFSRADVVGKEAHYMFVEGRDATLLRFAHREHRFSHRVMGPTITARRDLFLDNPFQALQRGEDSAFLEAVLEGGGSIYSADRFNFVQLRSSRHTHTWDVGNDAIMATGDVAFFGFNDQHVHF